MGLEKYKIDFRVPENWNAKGLSRGFWDRPLANSLEKEFAKTERRYDRLIHDRRYLYELFRKQCAFELFTRKELEEKSFLMDYVLDRRDQVAFLKQKNTFDGQGIAKVFLDPSDGIGLISFMKRHRYSFLEMPIHQKDELSELAPKGVSTLNLLTWYSDSDNPTILNAAFQFSAIREIDSLGAGGIWVNLEPDHGISLGYGVQIFPQRKYVDRHPLTGYEFKKFHVLDWDDVYTFLVDMQLQFDFNGLLSIELALTENGPKLMGLSTKEILPYWLQLGDPLMIKIKLNS